MAADEVDAAEVPRAIRALWGQAEPGRRGPRPSLSIEQIAAAAVDLADREGLDAASMAAVARHLGFTTMSLYRYVDSKEELQAVMVDHAMGPAPRTDARLGWRRQLEEWARSEARTLVAHPWVLDVRLGSPPLGPHMIAWMESGMASLALTGLASQQVASSLLLLDGYVRNNILLGIQYGDPAATRAYGDRLRALVDERAFPTVSGLLAAGIFEAGEPGDFPGDEFEFGLRLLLDGIEQMIDHA